MEIILAKIVTILLLAGSFALICAGLFRRKLKLSQLSGKLLLLSVSGLASYAIIVALAIWKWIRDYRRYLLLCARRRTVSYFD